MQQVALPCQTLQHFLLLFSLDGREQEETQRMRTLNSKSHRLSLYDCKGGLTAQSELLKTSMWILVGFIQLIKINSHVSVQ